MEKCKNLVSVCKTVENFFLRNCSTKFLDIVQCSSWVCVIKVCSTGFATYIFFIEIIAKDNLNIAHLMQTFENLLLQNYSKEFFEIAH